MSQTSARTATTSPPRSRLSHERKLVAPTDTFGQLEPENVRLAKTARRSTLGLMKPSVLGFMRPRICGSADLAGPQIGGHSKRGHLRLMSRPLRIGCRVRLARIGDRIRLAWPWQRQAGRGFRYFRGNLAQHPAIVLQPWAGRLGRTPYTQLADQITNRIRKHPLAGRTQVAIDPTGVGAPIVDLFKKQLPTTPLFAITITAGTSTTGTARHPHVPKRDLISTASVVLEQRRLRIAPALTKTDTLIDELINYRRTTSETGHDTYGPSTRGAQDDLLLALILATWIGEHKTAKRQGKFIVPHGRIPGVKDRRPPRYR